jgi:hypothetical protein
MSEKLSQHEDSPIEKSPIVPARSSIDTITDSEAARENARSANPNGFVRTTSGVDVKAAEEEFAHLQRELSGISQTSRRLSRNQSKVKGGEDDVEKVGTSEGTTEAEAFDLEHTLRGNHTVSILHESLSLYLSEATRRDSLKESSHGKYSTGLPRLWISLRAAFFDFCFCTLYS